MNSKFKSSYIVLLIHLFACIHSLNNGLAQKPPMGWATWNLYQRSWTSQVFYDAADVFISSGMKSAGYEYINIGGDWWWAVNSTVIRNSTGYIYPSPIKFGNNGTNNQTIQNVIHYVHSQGLKWGHYTDAGTTACNGDVGMSENYMEQDIALFVEWGMDAIKVDACGIKGNDTEIIFKWRDMLNATNKSIAFSNCRNQCLNDVTGTKNFEPWCVNLSNWWRVSSDISASWNSMLHNLDSTKSLGKYGQPSAWNHPDSLEIDIGEFKYDGTSKSLLMNQAHFSLWCIVSAPLICGNNLTNMSTHILNILIDKDALDVNQNYLDNAGDIITEFNITKQFKSEYEKQVINNNNKTELFYKPLPRALNNSYAAFVFLNRDIHDEYNVSVQFNQFPFTNNHTSIIKCDTLNIWTKKIITQQTKYIASLPPQSVKFIKLFNCI